MSLELFCSLQSPIPESCSQGGQKIWTVLSRHDVTEAGKRQLFVMMEGQEKQGHVEVITEVIQSDLLN